MSASADDHAFNWVKARHECSMALEFRLIRKQVDRMVEERNSSTNGRVRFVVRRASTEVFSVENSAGMSQPVVFELSTRKIAVHRGFGCDPLELTLTLNDDGECRYRICGDGEYLRWQVIRRALEDLFFPQLLTGAR
ncbi:MAG: hypothetical protein OXN89_09460 [Bryobacterales bacterium]|nr:hypothetical protein [Bryobacterales bacterium]